MSHPDTRVKQLSEHVWIYRHNWERLEPTVGMILTEEGWIAVDGGNSPRHGRQVVEAMRQIRDLPVRWVVCTHRHFDHVFGNQAFEAPVLGSLRFAQRLAENLQSDWAPGRALDWLKATIFQYNKLLTEEDFQGLNLVPPEPGVDAEHVLYEGEISVILVPLEGVHSDDGIGVFVPEEHVVLLGDAFYFQGTPEGRALQLLPLARRVAALDAKVFAPGHERAFDDVVFERFHHYVRELSEIVRRSVAANMDAAAALKQHPFPEQYKNTSFLDEKTHRLLLKAGLRELSQRHG